jgi:hypothetical protein
MFGDGLTQGRPDYRLADDRSDLTCKWIHRSLAAWMHPIAQKHDKTLQIGVDPERRAGEP